LKKNEKTSQRGLQGLEKYQRGYFMKKAEKSSEKHSAQEYDILAFSSCKRISGFIHPLALLPFFESVKYSG